MNDEDMDGAIEDIVSQLGDVRKASARLRKESDPLTKENLEEFIIRNAGNLVERSLEMVDKVHELSDVTPDDPEAFESAASIIKSADSAIQSLSKIMIADDKNKLTERMKRLEIDSKNERNQTNNQTRLMMSRDDMMRAIMHDDGVMDSEGNVIDV